MELVLFIILGGYLLLRVGSEKAASYVARQDRQKEKEIRETWIKKVTNPELEAELKAYVDDPKNIRAVLDEVRDVYDAIFEKWPEQKRKEFDCTARRLEYALRVLLAKRGFLTKSDAFDGSLVWINLYLTLERDLFEWIDSELRRRGSISEPYVKREGNRVGWKLY